MATLGFKNSRGPGGEGFNTPSAEYLTGDGHDDDADGKFSQDFTSYFSHHIDEFTVSDDEGEPKACRISPCTFRLWAKECKRWDAKLLGVASEYDEDDYNDDEPHFAVSNLLRWIVMISC